MVSTCIFVEYMCV